MRIKWEYKVVGRKHFFSVPCEDENTAINLEADFYAWLMQNELRAVKTLQLRRISERTEVRDRLKCIYNRYNYSQYSYTVALQFNNDAEAVAFKLRFG